jgi:hypothetical protein
MWTRGRVSRSLRGRTQDLSFEQWANKIYNVGAGMGQEVSLKDYRKTIVI